MGLTTTTITKIKEPSSFSGVRSFSSLDLGEGPTGRWETHWDRFSKSEGHFKGEDPPIWSARQEFEMTCNFSRSSRFFEVVGRPWGSGYLEAILGPKLYKSFERHQSCLSVPPSFDGGEEGPGRV